MRFTSLKLSVLALAVIGALAIAPAAMATTCPAGDTCMDLTQSNLNVAGPYGTVELSQNGANVDVTIAMNPGFAVLLNGGDLGINTTGGLVLNGNSLSGFNISGVSTSLKSNGTIGSFSFNYIFKTSVSGGQQFPTTLSFTISGATISQLTGFGIHLCVVAAQGNGCALTGFAVTGNTPPAVPEPGTLGMLGTGLVGIAGLVRRRFIS